MLTMPTGDTPTNQPLCQQKCATAACHLAGETSTSVMDSDCAMQKGRSCDLSHDPSDSKNDIFLTPPTSPVPPQHDDRELVSHNKCSQYTCPH